jgi:hypothetical protein
MTQEEAGRLIHEIRVVQSGDDFEAYFEHALTSFFTDKNTKTVRETKMTAIFNAHNLVYDEGKPIRVTAVLLEPSNFTAEFAKQWDLNPEQVQKLLEKMGCESGTFRYLPAFLQRLVLTDLQASSRRLTKTGRKCGIFASLGTAWSRLVLD